MKESIVNTVPTITTTRPYVADPADMAAITGKPAQQCHVHSMHVAATLSVGQQVTVFADQSSWLNGRTGTVKVLPVRNGLLRNEQIAVEIHGDTPLGSDPVRWCDPRRVAPTCDTCREGCDCDGAKGATDCGHYACHGRADGQTASRCPGADVERARYAAANFAHHGVTR